MGKELTKAELDVERLLPEINANHRECMKSGNEALRHAMQAGDLLWKLKECVKHGEWQPLIEKRCDFSLASAKVYMNLSAYLPGVMQKNGKSAIADMTIRGGMKLIAEAKPAKRQMANALAKSAKAGESRPAHVKAEPPKQEKTPEPEGPLNDEPEPELTFSDQVKQANGQIESFCRQLVKHFEDNCPKLQSIDHMGRFDSALSQVRAACSTLRTCKYHDEPCPKCSGSGCAKCDKESDFGAVTVLTYRQLAG